MSNKDNTSDTLLEIKDLHVHYPITSGFLQNQSGEVKAVDGVSFQIKRGTTVGLVGESGSGKTTIGRSIIKLAPITSGEILYNGTDIASMSNNDFSLTEKRFK